MLASSAGWWVVAAAVLLAPMLAAARDRGVTNTSASPHVRLRSVDLDDVTWTEGLWAEKLDLCRKAIIPTIGRALADPHNAAVLSNFRVAAGLAKGKHVGTNWSDGDCYKYLESLAHVQAAAPDERIDRLLDEWIAVIAKAQAPDGYLSTNIQLTAKKRLAHPHNHEMYNMGHLLTAACVHHRATGKVTFLNVARKLGDYLYRTFQPRPARLAHFGWNPSNIMGLVELYRTTRDRRYLEVAGTFVSMRGSAKGTDLSQDRVPIREETIAVGHCVCATYLYCGAADVCAETGDPALRKALERIWQDVTASKTYLTGAIGSFRNGKSVRGDDVHEAFGAPYQLPSRTAYNETCSNIGNAMWGFRMLALTGEANYADVMERVLYNSALSAVGVDGKGFLYCNPLSWDGKASGPSFHHTGRRWSVHRCYCCPPQVARTLAKLHGWAYSVSDDGVWVNLYGGSRLTGELPDGSAVRLSQQTRYPWAGRVKVTVEAAPRKAIALRLRIPGWADRAAIRVNGQRHAGAARPGTYAAIRRTWSRGDTVELDVPMRPRLMVAHPKVRSLRGRVAVMRGPVVYCLESPDLPAGTDFGRIALPAGAKLTPRFRKDLLGGVTVLTARAVLRTPDEAKARPASRAARADATGPLYRELKAPAAAAAPGRTVDITLIPYFAWANRGISHMAVWLPLAQ